ncbi:MAG: transcription-repair coupling factor, partial [Pirellulales bacterium]
ERGFQGTSTVEFPGEFSSRGGILDIYAPDGRAPVRVEWFGDEIESLRRFDVVSQRSLETICSVSIAVAPLRSRTSSDDASCRDHLASYLPPTTWVLLIEPAKLDEEGGQYRQRLDRPDATHTVADTFARLAPFPTVIADPVASGAFGTAVQLPVESVERFSGDVSRVRDELESAGVGQQVVVVSPTEAESERLGEILGPSQLAAEGRLQLSVGRLSSGFRLVTQQIVLVSSAELFQRVDLARTRRRPVGRAIDSFLSLSPGDLVVHLAHGIGRFRGLKLLGEEGQDEEHLQIEFHGGTTMYVPTSKIDLVQKYVGGSKTRPSLARIGSTAWNRQKQAAEKAVNDLAAEMLELQAARAARPGIAFPDDSTWQREFDASFPYEETPDQLSALDAIKQDMRLARPMDRLLCGDVGFGKTELAIRSAFKAVDAGYQVAVLVPTTILAEQHHRTFHSRMAEFPIEIATLSRFSTRKEQTQVIKRLRDGAVDVVIGTHRLAGRDVAFHNLGLVIIDEEQRFGVAVKERIKSYRATVDILTMTATPIPRTLHMSLMGVRSISNLETAPEDRLSVETRVLRWDDDPIRHAVLRELNRDGQIFFVHNRVRDLRRVAARLTTIVPEARLEIAHGQMPEGELEEVMLRFMDHQFDLLLATTIIESGLDIPNANTIFIDDADHYGLADLHQLRGRVGRYKHRAHAYLLIDPNRHVTPEAARRLRAIEEFSEMGAGFAIAMRDLELRGAGNILGTQQSGHIAQVGYELYCSLLDRAVRQLKWMPIP